MHTSDYGCWQSPISAALLARGNIGLSHISTADGKLYWIESRGGVNMPVEYADGGMRDLLPEGFSARSTVHEYGGISYLVAAGQLYFVNFSDQQIYRMPLADATPRQLTRETNTRFVELQLDAGRNRLLCVAERHDAELAEPQNYLATVALDGGKLGCLVEGDDFYAAPRLSPDGSLLAFISWRHPNMPWDETHLWLKRLDTGEVTEVPGGGNAARVQPDFDAEGRLVFSSDLDNWWNLYRVDGPGAEVVRLTELEAEAGAAHWVFGQRNHFGLPDGRRLLLVNRRADTQLAILDDGCDGQLAPLEQPFPCISSLAVLNERELAMIAAGPETLPQVVRMNLQGAQLEVLQRAASGRVRKLLQKTGIATPEALEFPSSDGRVAHGFFYPPCNRRFRAPAAARPPLLVKLHGGPTSHTDRALSLLIQYWTSRGFAVLDVNYRGSTGYGRDYRQQLNGAWGLADLDDAEAGVAFLVKADLVDGERVVIRGGSAGGFSVLAALTFRSSFRTGASYYGISDLTALAEDTHKFESRYLERLVGPWPEAKETWLARSPIKHLHRLNRPVIFFQGLEDRVVPPNQAQLMVQALKEKGLPVSYLEFEGEGHGFRQPENIRRALSAELCFYGKVLGFQPGDDLEPVVIDNLPTNA